ncbi:MAG: potassium channel family protein [Gammaproteobacteria bacterium]|nr:potassium channel family protein [Gammaproteobacteria bacterium]
MEFTFAFLRTLWTDLSYAGPLLIFLLLLIGLIGYIIGRIEGWSLSDSLYHAFINATTVGYGDFRPARGRAKFLAIVLAFVGLVFTGMVVAIALHAANDSFGHVYETDGFVDR